MTTTLDTFYDQVKNRYEAMQPVDLVREQSGFAYRSQPDRHLLISLGDGEEYTLQDHALQQLCGRYQIPYPFFQRMPTGLQNLTMNHFVQNQEKSRSCLRVINGNEVRAILSERFAPLDDLDLFRIVRDVFEGEGVEVRLNVALRAGVAVVPPGTADVVGFLQNDEVVDAGPTQLNPSTQPARAGPDDGHVNPVGQRRGR